MTHAALISIVVPAYNEADNLEAFLARLDASLAPDTNIEIVVVDDGSRDGTLKLLKSIAATDSRLHYVTLTRNFGHQAALRVGLTHARGDAVISLDADLQHPPEEIPRMLEQWQQGAKVVNMVRDLRHGSWFKRVTSRVFYRLINAISDHHIVPGSSDFRLLDHTVVDIVRRLPEHGVFLRGLIPWLGYRQSDLHYSPDQRHAGDSKYSLFKMVRLALHGLTSSSFRPLHLSTILGAVMSFLAMLYAVYALGVKLFLGTAISGWTSLLISVVLLGGVQLLMLGIIGEYVGRVLLEVKGRPDYLVLESNIKPSDGASPHRQRGEGQAAREPGAQERTLERE